jgi:hypothetical protein
VLQVKLRFLVGEFYELCAHIFKGRFPLQKMTNYCDTQSDFRLVPKVIFFKEIFDIFEVFFSFFILIQNNSKGLKNMNKVVVWNLTKERQNIFSKSRLEKVKVMTL